MSRCRFEVQKNACWQWKVNFVSKLLVTEYDQRTQGGTNIDTSCQLFVHAILYDIHSSFRDTSKGE